jgi:hypothetical protein
LLEPKPPIETDASTVVEPTATANTAAIDTAVIESAPATKDAESTVAETTLVVEPSERVASLPSPADTEAVGPGNAKSQATAPGSQVQKATPVSKPKAKKKVAKRKPSPRTAQRPAVDSGFPGITTRNGQDNWLFNRN